MALTPQSEGAFLRIPPLNWQTPIVDPVTGNPSPQFIRLWQQVFHSGTSIEGLVITMEQQIVELIDLIADLQQLINQLEASKADKTTQIIVGSGLQGGGDLSGDVSIELADTPVTPGSYTNTDLTVDQKGRLTAASNG